MGRPKLYHTAAQKREATLAKKRRYYERHQEEITEKARKKYRAQHPPKSKETILKSRFHGAEQSELSVHIDRYLDICVQCDDLFRPSEVAFARSVCDLVLLTEDVGASSRALKQVDTLYDALLDTMNTILQIDGVGDLWRQCDVTLKQLRNAVGFVTEIECYASDIGGLRQSLANGDLGFQAA